MYSVDELRRGLASMSVYRGLLRQPVFQSLAGLLNSEDSQEAVGLWGNFACSLYSGGEVRLARLIGDAVLYDDNIFTRLSSKGEPIPVPILQAAARELAVLELAAKMTPNALGEALGLDAESLPSWETGDPPPALNAAGWDQSLREVAAFHKKSGFGDFARYNAFTFREGQLLPVEHTNKIRLEDLKKYEIQRNMVVDNTQAFLMGLPANNVLLYGDRGTGKSSTVHALLNEYAGQGLRMVEITKEEIGDFAALATLISQVSCRFIIFIDDLSFSQGDDTYAGLKAVLEGGLVARPENAIIYATSNRRHLVRERFSDRQGDEIHLGDTMQELLSLSDRFGLSITFINPTKKEYGEILLKIAADRGLAVDEELLLRRAERFALERGGRSPRIARQFVDMAEARLKRGQEL